MKRFMILALGLLFLAVPGFTAAQEAPSLKVLLESAILFDQAGETITLPLFEGTQQGETVWYVITDSSDRDDASVRGVNWAPKLANALGTAAVQTVAEVGAGVVEFQGTVDFRPERVLEPGPTVFPPATAIPGSIGDGRYSPLATRGDGIVHNAPHVANGTGRHDKVVAIDFSARTVTLRLTAGFYHDRAILYLSTESSDPVGATLEESTFAPNMNAAPGIASNGEDSARAPIIAIVNGETGPGPNRQGLISAILGEGSPLNVTVEHPNRRHQIPLYSPLWDVHPAVWTDAAIAAGERRLLTHHQEIARAVEDGLLLSGGFGPANPDLGGLRATGFIVNCPIMAVE